MVKDYLTRQIKEKFSYVPTFQQDYAIKILAEYVTAPGSGAVMLLKGYAGTGKTSIAAALVKTLAAAGQSTCLLAPTGRAAKVFSGYAGSPAYTIHKKIYRQREFGTETRFDIDFNKTPRTVFLLDEASMISNTPAGYSMFGSGRLLDDLIAAARRRGGKPGSEQRLSDRIRAGRNGSGADRSRKATARVGHTVQRHENQRMPERRPNGVTENKDIGI